MSRPKSSHQWYLRHKKDTYVKQAQQDHYRSRAVYKLAQLDEKDKLFRPGMTVIDLGAAPGGWSQWLKRQYDDNIHVIALDMLPMDAIPGVIFIQGDFRENEVLDNLLNNLENKKVDLVMSDMSPNMSGMRAVDQPRAMLLAELARDLALQTLSKEGHFVTKLFQGEGFDDYIKELKEHFKQVVIRKPHASRDQSREIYVLAKHYCV